MELLLHFIFPYFLFTLIGERPRRAFILGLFAVLPDLDVLFLIHRSPSHSLAVILAAASVPLALIYLKRRDLVRPALLAVLATMSHPVFDTLGGYTPILWPLSPNSYYVQLQLMLVNNPGLRLIFNYKVSATPTVFTPLTNFSAVVISGPEALVAAAVLLLITSHLVRRLLVRWKVKVAAQTKRG